MEHRFLFPFSDFLREQKLVFQHGAHAAAEAEEDEEGEVEHERWRRGEHGEHGVRETAEVTQHRIQAIEAHPEFPAEIRMLGRQAARSESPALRYYVDQLLKGQLSPDQFRQNVEQQQEREESWRTIFTVQRHIRSRINELHERAESYVEAIPSENFRFQNYLEQIGQLNLRDMNVDNEMKGILQRLSRETPAAEGHPARPALLNEQSAKRIYELDPTEPGFDQAFLKLSAPLRGETGDRRIYNRLLQLKEEERKIERHFNYIYDAFQKIIERNLSRATRIALEEKLIQNATRATGINVRPGTVIRYQDSDILSLAGRTQTTRIQDVTFERVPIFDHQGKIINYAVGIPIIRILNMKMPLGRFHKWVDATNAVEEISGIADVEKHIGWNTLGLKLKPGVELEYQIIRRVNGELQRIPEHVHIREIKNGHVIFTRPVTYQTGPFLEGRGIESEERESLTLGEFVKWYHRNEVEQALSVEQLRTSLKEYNKNFNNLFGLKTKENPPIELFSHEKLFYPDGSGIKFEIKNVEQDKITLDNGVSYTPAQFLYWVRNNHVQREPPVHPVKTKEEIEREQEAREKKEKEEKETEYKQHEAEHEAEHRRKAYAERESIGVRDYLKKVWFSTTILSFKDIFHFMVAIKDFVKRKHERRSKARYSEVGSKLPWVIGTEFERIRQAAENEEVHQYAEAMDHWGIFQVKETLHKTNSKDEAKACIETLVKKGEMRFDDHHFWETLNRLTARYTTQGAKLKIPHKEHMPPGMSGEDMTHASIDALWGQGTGAEWFQKNISTYNNNKKSYMYKGDQLEADPKSTGGLKGELQRLLLDWRNGEYVNPQEYETLIEFSIVKGKMSAEDKLFFLIMGIVAANPKMGDETLLHLDRTGQLDGEHLNRFPLLDFFTNKGAFRPYDGTTGPWRIEDYRYWVENNFPEDMKVGRPGIQFTNFLWKTMIFDDNFRTRLSKGLRNAEQMDHDDAHLFISPATIEEINILTGGPAGGEKKYWTTQGYANAYPGFNQYFIALATKDWKPEEEQKRQQALKDGVKSFVRYDAIVDNRYFKKEGDRRGRLSELHYNRPCVVDNTVNLRLHQQQLHNLIRNICRAYNYDCEHLFKKTGPYSDPTERQAQDQLEILHAKFTDQIVEQFFKVDGGKRVVEEVRKAKERDSNSPYGLRGMRGWTTGRDMDKNTGIITEDALQRAKRLNIL